VVLRWGVQVDCSQIGGRNWEIQEAQLLLGDRATRKHAKDCWNGRGNDNLDWNDLQMYFKVIKSGTNRKLVYDFLLVVYSNLLPYHTPFLRNLMWNSPIRWNMPKVIDSRITWKLLCGRVCKMFGRQCNERMKRKSPFQLPYSHLTPPLQRTPANICINLIPPVRQKLRSLGYFLSLTVYG